MNSAPLPAIFSDEQAFADDYITRHRESVATTTIPRFLDKVIKHKGKKGMYVQVYGSEKKGMVIDSDLGTMALGYGHRKLLQFLKKNWDLAAYHADGPGRYWAMKNVDAGWKRYDEISPAALARKFIPLAFPKEPIENYQVAFNITGGLAVKDAAHLARFLHKDKNTFLIFERGFHGRVIPELNFSNPGQKVHAPQGSVSRYVLPYPETADDFRRACYLLPFIPQDVAAIFIEGIQGEGGINMPNPLFLKLLVEKLREHFAGIMVIFDEIQTGMGRTGKWFSFQHYDIKPDIVIAGKALGGSAPLSAIIMPNCPIPDGLIGGTYAGGYPLAVAYAMIILDIMQEDGLVQRAKKMGAYLARSIHTFFEKSGFEEKNGQRGVFLRHKGFGLMQGIEFFNYLGEPCPDWQENTLRELFKRNIFTTSAGVRGINHVLRIMPPLTVTKKDIDYLMQQINESIFIGLLP